MSPIMAKKQTGASNRPYVAILFFFLVSFSLHVPRARRGQRPLFQPTANSFLIGILPHGNQKISLHCRPFLSTYRPKTGHDFRKAV
jgi:hypothetical protein